VVDVLGQLLAGRLGFSERFDLIDCDQMGRTTGVDDILDLLGTGESLVELD
jgi:hypothetical protein